MPEKGNDSLLDPGTQGRQQAIGIPGLSEKSKKRKFRQGAFSVRILEEDLLSSPLPTRRMQF